MSTSKILVIGFISFLTSCVSVLHTHNTQYKVEVYDDNPKLTSLIDNINKIESEIYDETYFLILPKLEAISDEDVDIDFFYYHNDNRFFTTRETGFLLLNNKSLYVGKSPVLNKNDSNSNRKINIIICSLLLNNWRKPKIRSPTYYI